MSPELTPPSTVGGLFGGWYAASGPSPDERRLEGIVRRHMTALGFDDEAAVRSALAAVADRLGPLEGEARLRRAVEVLCEQFAGRVSGPQAACEARAAVSVARRRTPAAPRSAANRMPVARLRSPLSTRLRHLARRLRPILDRPVLAGFGRGA